MLLLYAQESNEDLQGHSSGRIGELVRGARRSFTSRLRAEALSFLKKCDQIILTSRSNLRQGI